MDNLPRTTKRLQCDISANIEARLSALETQVKELSESILVLQKKVLS